MPARAQSPSTPQALIVRAVETTAIRVPLARTPQLRDGILQLSEQPGLGRELDEDFIGCYRVWFA